MVIGVFILSNLTGVFQPLIPPDHMSLQDSISALASNAPPTIPSALASQLNSLAETLIHIPNSEVAARVLADFERQLRTNEALRRLLLKFRPKFPGFKTRLKCVKGTPVLALPGDESPSNAT